MQPLKTIASPSSRIHHRLRATLGQVDDLEAPVPQRHSTFGEDAGAVGSAGDHRAGHRIHGGDVGPFAVEPDFSAYSAHDFSRLSSPDGVHRGVVPD